MNQQTMRQIRRWHLYLGMFFAPMIFLFALSGALQTFRLQEEKGWGGTPPGWIVMLASVHKDSKLPEARAEKPAPKPSAGAPKAPPSPPRHFSLPMKILAVLMSVGLMFSVATGVWIALQSRITRRTSLVMLGAGVIVPVALLLLLL